MLETVSELVALANKGEQAFMAVLKVPVLVVATGLRGGKRPPSTASMDARSTARVDRRAATLLFASAKIVLLERTGRHPFPMITLGRGPTNDVILEAEGISKLHATFVEDGTAQWSITDAGTTNGTVVNEKPLAPRAMVNINDGDEIVFGNELTTLFFRPRGLYGWARVNRVLFSS